MESQTGVQPGDPRQKRQVAANEPHFSRDCDFLLKTLTHATYPPQHRQAFQEPNISLEDSRLLLPLSTATIFSGPSLPPIPSMGHNPPSYPSDCPNLGKEFVALRSEYGSSSQYQWLFQAYKALVVSTPSSSYPGLKSPQQIPRWPLFTLLETYSCQGNVTFCED